MEREEFKTLVKGMKAVYAQPTFIPDQNAFNVWYELLKDLPYKQVNAAIQKHMVTERFPPTIADLREKSAEIVEQKTGRMSELEAWAHVRKAIGNSLYHAEEEFERLPEACRIAVGNPNNLREWGQMDSEQVETVEQSHFIRNYRAAEKRISNDRKIPASVMTMITEIQEEHQQKIEAADRARLAVKTPENPAPPVRDGNISYGMPEVARKKLEEILGRKRT